ncbi:MAG: response regulator, partial [Methylocella sp.]
MSQKSNGSSNGTPALAAPADDAAHLLIVDDDRRIRALLSRVLSEEGYRVTTAADAAEAMARLKSLSFDLIVLDVMMPGEDGFSFAARLRAGATELARVPILMLTARSEAEDRVRGLETGADDYLGKPCEPRELALRIASILRRAA